MKWMYNNIIVPEYLRWKKNWKGSLVFVLVICGISAFTGVKTDDLMQIIVGSFIACVVIVLALHLIFRGTK